jgi:predicted nucleotidyltransferase
MSHRIIDKDSLISILKSYFLHKADTYNIDMVFLYGSWASGSISKESDIDIAVIFEKEINGEESFEIATNISLELTDILKREVNVLCIDKELSKPMLRYNAII